MMVNPHPRNDEFGYEASLDFGIAALENGLTTAAIPYLERAVSLRRTRFALVQLGKAHRDFGQLEAARNCLEQARALPDGNDLFVLVTLAAVHCDLREHGSAFEVAMAAARLEPKDPATLSVLARCMRESASALSKHDHLDQTAIEKVLAQADEFARKAKAAQPDSVNELKERRRRRTSQVWQVPLQSEESMPVEQDPASILDRSPVVTPSDAGDGYEQPPEPAAILAPDAEARPESIWRRTWRRIAASVRPR
jgi:tetratricopeptide (TPR) repeat protein